MTTGSGTFCPRCGDPVDPAIAGASERGLCTDCYLEDFELVDAPDTVDVTVCAHCGAVKRGEDWEDVDARDLTEVAIQEVTAAVKVHREAEDVAWTVEPEQVDPTTIVLHATFTATVRDRDLEEHREITVSIGKGTCQRCGKIAGNSYGSVVQVRASDRVPTDEEVDRAVEIAHNVTADIAEKGDREAFVTEVIDADHGPDVKLSTPKLGRQVATKIRTELGGNISESETLVTEDADGNEVYRVTYAVRLPAFRPGDVIAVPAVTGPVLVQSVQSNLKGVALKTGDPYERAFEDGTAPGATKLGSRADAASTTVVAVLDENAIQVLDPATSETETVSRPSYFDPADRAVEVFRADQELFVLPPA